MSEPVWVDKTTLLLLHSAALSEHGGIRGLRDEGLLDSALARPRNLFAYEGVQSLSRLAAAYAVGISRNHPSIALALFLARNGNPLCADQVDATEVMFNVAAGRVPEAQLAEWIQARLSKRSEPE